MSKKARGKKALYADVDPSVYDLVTELSLAVGCTKAEVIETLVAGVRFGLDGKPLDWPTRLVDQEELPLAESA